MEVSKIFSQQDSQVGYIGLTDPEWYKYLSTQPRIDEVNYWQPHGGHTFKAIKKGDPFFFKLRAPFKAIAGFGFFERYESLPAWLAWECFGPMNGAPDFETMLDRILRLRKDEPSRAGKFSIGCIMVTAPVFFEKKDWIAMPMDWAKTGIQQGKRYALTSGEGNRIYRECLDRANLGNHYWNVDRIEESSRYGSPVLVRPRLGQGIFRLDVRNAYHGACAITGEHSGPVLEAAHIIPYQYGGTHSVDNGLLLRSDLHRLYDSHYVTVTPDYEFRVSERLREEFNNGHSYYSFDGKRIHLPNDPALRPRRESLEWHLEKFMK